MTSSLRYQIKHIAFSLLLNLQIAMELGITVNLGRERKIATASEAHFIIIKERILLDFYIEDILLGNGAKNGW